MDEPGSPPRRCAATAIEELRQHCNFAPLAKYELRVLRESPADAATPQCARVLTAALSAAAAAGDANYVAAAAETIAAIAAATAAGARALFVAGAAEACDRELLGRAAGDRRAADALGAARAAVVAGGPEDGAQRRPRARSPKRRALPTAELEAAAAEAARDDDDEARPDLSCERNEYLAASLGESRGVLAALAASLDSAARRRRSQSEEEEEEKEVTSEDAATSEEASSSEASSSSDSDVWFDARSEEARAARPPGDAASRQRRSMRSAAREMATRTAPASAAAAAAAAAAAPGDGRRAVAASVASLRRARRSAVDSERRDGLSSAAAALDALGRGGGGGEEAPTLAALRRVMRLRRPALPRPRRDGGGGVSALERSLLAAVASLSRALAAERAARPPPGPVAPPAELPQARPADLASAMALLKGRCVSLTKWELPKLAHVAGSARASAFKDAHLSLKRELMVLTHFRDFGVGGRWRGVRAATLAVSDDALITILAQIRRLVVAFDNSAAPPPARTAAEIVENAHNLLAIGGRAVAAEARARARAEKTHRTHVADHLHWPDARTTPERHPPGPRSTPDS